ncbi:MAG: PKD domain-containing protein [Candidatus Bathyarchaeota archaeon]|nr:MAG: PKD domain-containing protein [Candidatus Bathyarchaeota archaeon]
MRAWVLRLIIVASFLLLSTAGVAQTSQPPVADAGPDLFELVGIPVTLDGSNSADLDGTIISFEWDFGDSSPPYAETSASAPDGLFDGLTTHIYPFGGYTVTLTVTDDDGLTDADAAAVMVANQAPVADAGGPYSGVVGYPVTLDGSGSYDPDSTIISWEWDLDNDGQFDDGAGVTIDVAFNVGTHVVGIKVTDDYGDTDTDTSIVTIIEAAGVPESPLQLPILVSIIAAGYLILRRRGKESARG